MADDLSQAPVSVSPGDQAIQPPKETPASRSSIAVLGSEVANVLRNVYVRPYAGILYPHDATLRTRGGGWNYLIYEQAEEDPRVFAALQKRKRALLAYPWQLDAASDGPADVAAKELVERALATVPFSRLVMDQLDAINKGFAVDEIMWGIVDGEILPVDAIRRDQRRWRFAVDGSLRLLDWSNLLTGTPVPDRKFVVHKFDERDGDPYGRGLGRMLFWKALFKRQNEAAWLIHNDKFGSPTVVGKHPPMATDDQINDLLASCSAFALETAIAISDDQSIELVESSRAAGADTFKIFKDSANTDIDEIVLGSTYASNAGPLDGGSGANADQEDRLELAKADASEIAETLNRSLIKWVVEINMPAARPPKLKWLIEAEEDLGARAERDDKIQQWGFEQSEDEIRRIYGGDWTKKPEPVPQPPQPPALPPEFAQFMAAAKLRQALSFAEAKPPVGHLIDQLADLAAPTIEHQVGQFKRMATEASSLEELRDNLLDLYPKLSGAHFAELMQAATTLADLTGRDDVLHHGG